MNLYFTFFIIFLTNRIYFSISKISCSFPYVWSHLTTIVAFYLLMLSFFYELSFSTLMSFFYVLSFLYFEVVFDAACRFQVWCRFTALISLFLLNMMSFLCLLSFSIFLSFQVNCCKIQCRLNFSIGFKLWWYRFPYLSFP